MQSIGASLKPFQIGDDEQTYLFDEVHLEKVAEVCKAKRKVKRELTEEQKEVLRERIKNVHKNGTL